MKRLSTRIKKILAEAAKLAARGKRSRADRSREFHIVYSRLYRIARRRAR
jgi:hypothetical protein